ncbi:hypothetical protein Fot_32417 [Forsythia ovata]|uniref:Uncharacterized protein n=1 Tax=Forsythia ovata TaxID=205694 RepID=A0ABD1T7R0_9LAMI
MASTRAKRTTAETSSRRDKKKSKKSKNQQRMMKSYIHQTYLEVIQFVATNEEKNEIYASGLFYKKQTGNEFGASSSRPAPRFHSRMSSDPRAEDVEVGREVQFDRKGKRVQVDKSNNESGPEFEVGGEEPKKYLFEGTFVSKCMFDVLNFCPSFDLGIDDEPNANDIELDDMEFTELDLKMIDECVQMRYLSTSKNEESMIVLHDIPRKRLRKAAAVFKSPYTSNFGSSAKIREIRTGTYALPDELNAVAIEDVVDFEEWYIVGLLKKNK